MFCTPCLVVFPTHFSQLDLKPANLEYSKGRMNSGVSQTSLRIGTLLVQSKQQKRSLVYQSSQVYQDCTNSVPIVKTVKRQLKQQKNDHWCTNRHMSTKTVPTVYQSSKTIKNSQTAKNDHWCTNRHMSTQSPPNTQSPRPPSASTSASTSAFTSAEYTKPNAKKRKMA